MLGMQYFALKGGEFDEALFRHIKGLLNFKPNVEITISIKEQSTDILRNETKEEYFGRLLKAKENLNNSKNVISIKAGQLENFDKFLLNEP